MSDTSIDLDAAADIYAAIEAAGGDVTNFETALTQKSLDGGIGSLMDAVVDGPTRRVYRFEVTIPGDTSRPNCDLPVDVDLGDTLDDAESNDEPTDDADTQTDD